MRKFLVFLVGLTGLAMSISGCVANQFRDTLVKDNYIHKYVEKNADIKPKKVGDSNVNFYVAKIDDSRKGHKFIWHKNGPLGLKYGFKTKLDNLTITITNLTKKALTDTGWNVIDNNTNADYSIYIKLNSLGYYDYFLIGFRKTDAMLNIKNKMDKIVIKKEVSKSVPDTGLADWDFSSQFKFFAGKSCVNYYTLLVNFFSSTDFKNAIMQDYFANLNNTTDNSSRQE